MACRAKLVSNSVGEGSGERRRRIEDPHIFQRRVRQRKSENVSG